MPPFPYPSGMPLKTPAVVAGWNPATALGTAVVSGAMDTVADFGRGNASVQTAGAVLSQRSHNSGKTYAEIVVTPNLPSGCGVDVAVARAINPTFPYPFGGSTDGGVAWITQINNNTSGGTPGSPFGSAICSSIIGTSQGYGSFLSSGVAMVALDLVNNQVWFGLNGVWYGVYFGTFFTGDPTNPTQSVGGGASVFAGTYFLAFQATFTGPVVSADRVATLRTVAPFSYPIPAGYSAFN